MQTRLHRRAFVETVLGAAGGLMFTGCKADRIDARTTGVSPGATAIIDTHTHFYDPTRPQGVPWPPRDDELLHRTVRPQDYLALRTPQKVTGTVVVEASPWLEDNQWILDLADREPFIVGFVGNLPVGTKQFSAQLTRFSAHTRFRGLRLRGVNLQTALVDPAFVSDLKLLSRVDLALDLVGGTEILWAADRLARLRPDQRIVIDHLAGVRVDGKAPPADWIRELGQTAQHPHVFAKVSGLVEGTGCTDGSAPADVEFYRPVLDVIWEQFGPDRLLYGSNWPVSERFAPLGTVQGIVRAYFASKGSGALEKVFAANAQAVYRWGQRSG